jgi:hypothetical protein
LMDKQAWKILRKLYPDSTQLESVEGECLHCLVETEMARKTEQDKLDQAKLDRKMPLSNLHVRNFYTRTRGVPSQSMVNSDSGADLSALQNRTCPLVSGTYHIMPRAWCHQWRRYIKTGEGDMPHAPDPSDLFCDAHRLALLPPHLEAYLHGETSQLLATTRAEAPASPAAVATISIPVGLRPAMDAGSVNALLFAGLSPVELAAQQMAMLHFEQNHPQQQQPSPLAAQGSQNEILDRENNVVVEVVTEDEWIALQETGCWPRQLSSFSVSFTVHDNGKLSFSNVTCRACDNSGSASASCITTKNRARSLYKNLKSAEKPLSPSLEY